MFWVLLNFISCLSFPDPGYFSFDIEEKSQTSIDFNGKNIVFFSFFSKSGPVMSFEAINENLQYIVDYYDKKYLIISSDVLLLKNLKNEILSISVWIIPKSLCSNHAFYFSTPNGLKLTLFSKNTSNNFCLFPLIYGLTQTKIIASRKIFESIIHFYKSTDLVGFSQPYQCGSECHFESSQPHFILINSTQTKNLNFQISFSTESNLNKNIQCSYGKIDILTVESGITPLKFEVDINNFRCTKFAIIGNGILLLSIIFWVLFTVILTILCYSFIKSRVNELPKKKNVLEDEGFLKK